jgi:glycosyltransferase involved in cell wall biosynthesis
MHNPSCLPSAFFLYRRSALRAAALRSPPGTPSRYSLYGLDEAAAAGFSVAHNLEREPGVLARGSGAVLDRAVRAAGWYSGDFASVLASRSRLNRADVVFSTVDTLGIPLTLLARRGLVGPPIVYAAIGLPERLVLLRSPRARRAYLDAYRRLHTVVAYGWSEVEVLRDWLGPGGPRVEFVPFGVDTEHFAPRPDVQVDTDVVSIGTDPRRDRELFLALARAHPEWSFRLVLPSADATRLVGVPANVAVETNLPFELVADRLARARAVVLPVRDNSYSGATTVLLQGMAVGKPVVATRTAAIATGYRLEDGVNCLLVSPGSLAELDAAVERVLADDSVAAPLGEAGRETVLRHFAWARYTDEITGFLRDAVESRRRT